MPKETMTPKERWLAVMNREKPDRVPMHYRATAEASAKLMAYLGCGTIAEVYERLHIDRVVSAAPQYVGPSIPADADVFGCRYTKVDYGTGVYRECIHSPLAGHDSVEEIEANYTWPSPDWNDHSGIADRVKGLEKDVIAGGGSEPFLTYKHLRGEEQAFVDLILNPEIVHYCLDKLYGLCYENTRRIYEQIPGCICYTGVSEDLGSQEALMYSPEHIRTYMLPRMKPLMDLAHDGGAFVFHHSDGAIREIIPDLIAAGVEILDPVQWRCKGMEREALKRDFGDRLVFHGAMDNQYTLAFGTVEEVRQEVLDNLRILGDGGGFIMGPCHNIQSVSPPENVVAMYETCYENGWS